MSAVMGALSGSKDIPSLTNPEMERDEETKDDENENEEPGNLPNNANVGENEETNADKLCRKLSYASVASTETEFEAEEEGEENIDLGPQCTLKEQLEKDKDDESLRRWKEQLLGSVDINDVGETLEPDVHISSLTILTPDQPDLVLPIPFVPDHKGFAFALKDGCPYRLKFTFVVSNNIVSGLKYTNTVWKTGVKVENTKVMLGTFSPQKEPYTYELEEETTPSGIFARGSYTAKTKFVDDDGKCYLDLNYYFEIRKDWPTPS